MSHYLQSCQSAMLASTKTGALIVIERNIGLAGVEYEAWDLERVVEMTEAFKRRKEDAKFEDAFAKLEC